MHFLPFVVIALVLCLSYLVLSFLNIITLLFCSIFSPLSSHFRKFLNDVLALNFDTSCIGAQVHESYINVLIGSVIMIIEFTDEELKMMEKIDAIEIDSIPCVNGRRY